MLTEFGQGAQLSQRNSATLDVIAFIKEEMFYNSIQFNCFLFHAEARRKQTDRKRRLVCLSVNKITKEVVDECLRNFGSVVLETRTID